MHPTAKPARQTLTSRAELLAHPAVRMWQSFRPRRPEPERLEVIREARDNGKEYKSLIYRLVGVGAGGTAVIAKRCPPATGAVERTVYEKILPHLPVPTPRYHGAVDDGDRCWLFVDEAGGERYSPVAAEHRALAAHWLAGMHVAAADVAAGLGLPDAGPARYLEHLRAARAGIRANLGNPVLRPDDLALLAAVLSLLDSVESRWGEVESCCLGLPRTLVHGDFVGSNVRVRAGTEGGMVLPFDWEHAGWGVPAADLARPAAPSTSFPATRPYWIRGAPASPDLAIYAAVVRRRWPELDPRTVTRLARCGTAYRCLAALEWETASIPHVSVMRLYAAELSDAMGEEGSAGRRPA
jgi:Phosphotransferase enzyme family